MSDLFAELGGTDRESRQSWDQHYGLSSHGSVSLADRHANQVLFERIAPLVEQWNAIGQTFHFQGKQYNFSFDMPTHGPKFKEISLPVAERKDKQGRAYWYTRIPDPLGYISARIACRYVDETEDAPWREERDFRKAAQKGK